ncbi:MAG: sugar-binding protein [Lachnospiraceae bacterium]|nr:sugar-binding protein [Lachnospiraceae bacterium]
MRKITAFILLSLLLTNTLAGCGNTQSVNNAKKSDEEELVINDTHSDDGRNIIGISMPSQSLERWNRDGQFLKENFEKAGFEVLLSYGNDLIDEQIDGIEYMLEEGADLLIITPIDASSLENVIKKAASSNVPIISYDRLILRSPYIDYYVSFDNYLVGKLQGEFILDALGLPYTDKTYNIEMVSGDPADNNAKFFYEGAYDVLSPFIESGQLKVPSGQYDFFRTSTSSWSKELAKERFENILNSYYASGKTLDAVCCANDSTALGTAEAIEMDYTGGNTVILTGQDADEANLDNIKNDKQTMTVFKHLSNESIVTLDLALAMLKGDNPGEDLIERSHWPFECKFDTTSYDNEKETISAYLLTPTVITKDNLYEELIEKGYYEEDANGKMHAK